MSNCVVYICNNIFILDLHGQDGILSSYGLNKLKFTDIFAEKPPIFESSLAPLKSSAIKTSTTAKGADKSKGGKSSTTTTPKSSPKAKNKTEKTSPPAGGKKSSGNTEKKPKK